MNVTGENIGYFCRWGVKSSGAIFLQLFNSRYHITRRSIKVSQSIFEGINMDNFQDNNRRYNVMVQGIDTSITSTVQELCLYFDRSSIIYNWYWYWSMAYTCVMDPSKKQFILPKFSKILFKTYEANIYSKVSQVVRKVFANIH